MRFRLYFQIKDNEVDTGSLEEAVKAARKIEKDNKALSFIGVEELPQTGTGE